MDRSSANCPKWLVNRITAAGGSISFYEYMDWVLNDFDHGAYGSGQLKIGKKGDFVTAPSLGPDFAELLAVQLVEWFSQLEVQNVYNYRFSLIEVGPGEGDLTYDLIKALTKLSPSILKNLEFVMVEINQGMLSRQRKRMSLLANVPIRWVSLEELERNPVSGVMLANEVLDAFPVERLVWSSNKLFRQGVKIVEKSSEPNITFTNLPLSTKLKLSIQEIQNSCGVRIPPKDVSDGWCTEWHMDIENWFKKVSESFKLGNILVIDYALEARRFYSSLRSSGTLMAYRNNKASGKFLENPGEYDLTSHLCLETLQYFAEKKGFITLGETRQGQALLALGLAETLHSLQYLPNDQLDVALQRRENILRLVDPTCLGEFRWLAFRINNDNNSID